MPSRFHDWRFLGDLARAAGRANTSRGLARCLGEDLGSTWRVSRVQIDAGDESIEAIASADGRWITRAANRPLRRPARPSARDLLSGRRLILPLADLTAGLWLDPQAPRVSSDERYLDALLAVASVAVDRQLLARRVARLSQRAHAESRHLRAVVEKLSIAPPLVTASAAMKRAVDRAAMVARFDTPVLVTGESGTGKEVIARMIHQRSARAAGPFVQINCGAIPDGLVESELFGHVRGAFTGAERDHRGVFERAAGGTLLLDEVGDLPPSAQVKLLRVLQEKAVTPVGGEAERPVDARIVAATHRPLRQMAAAGRFREDLLYRLDVFPIDVPPLRERREDLPALVSDLLDGLTARLGVDRPPVSRAVLEHLARHRWPGNVRELANVLETALIVGDGERLELPDRLGAARRGREPSRSFDDACRAAITAALERSSGKIYGPGGAAEELELHPATLQSKMRKLGVDRAQVSSRLTNSKSGASSPM